MSKASKRDRDRAKAHYEENRAKKIEYAREYRRRNREKLNQQDRERYLRERDARLAYEASPERRAKKAERMRVWRAKNPQLSRLQFRAWNYGLSIERLRAMLDEGCSVCGSKDRLHVDHDHSCCPAGSSPRSCGRCVRGVLCHGCNTAIGLLCESPERVSALLIYLRRRGGAK